HCGNTFCSAPSQFCCIPGNGGPGSQPPRCVNSSTPNLCPDTADRVACDDRTDCSDPGDVCCASDMTNGSSVARCMTLANCPLIMRRGQLLCDPSRLDSCLGTVTTTCSLDQ